MLTDVMPMYALRSMKNESIPNAYLAMIDVLRLPRRAGAVPHDREPVGIHQGQRRGLGCAPDDAPYRLGPAAHLATSQYC